MYRQLNNGWRAGHGYVEPRDVVWLVRPDPGSSSFAYDRGYPEASESWIESSRHMPTRPGMGSNLGSWDRSVGRRQTDMLPPDPSVRPLSGPGVGGGIGSKARSRVARMKVWRTSTPLCKESKLNQGGRVGHGYVEPRVVVWLVRPRPGKFEICIRPRVPRSHACSVRSVQFPPTSRSR